MKIEKLESGNFYHIYNRGNNGQALFLEEKNYYYFLNLIKKYLVPSTEVYAYCLLKNHFHILLKIKEDCQFPSKCFSNLFNAYTKAMNKKYDRTGSLLEKPFKRIRLKDENYLRTLVLYIHLNPEHHQISDDFSTYKFSSYQSIISEKETSLQRKTILEYFDEKENFIATHTSRKFLIEERNRNLLLE